MTRQLTLHTSPSVPVEAECLCPDRLAGLGADDITRLPLLHGNESAVLGDFFHVAGNTSDELRISGDLGRFKYVGANTSRGVLVLDGNAGAHLGAGMRGGEILVEGDAGDWVGPDMLAGRIVVKGNTGHMLGSAHRGSAVGVRGGEILVHGNTGNEAGNGMRRGLIAVAGDSGDFAGVNMLAGTIVVFGHLGMRPGASMKRGSIVSFQPASVLPTFRYAGRYQPIYLRLYLRHIGQLGMPVDSAAITGSYLRFSGDDIELNRGEILTLSR